MVSHESSMVHDNNYFMAASYWVYWSVIPSTSVTDVPIKIYGSDVWSLFDYIAVCSLAMKQ